MSVKCNNYSMLVEESASRQKVLSCGKYHTLCEKGVFLPQYEILYSVFHCKGSVIFEVP